MLRGKASVPYLLDADLGLYETSDFCLIQNSKSINAPVLCFADMFEMSC